MRLTKYPTASSGLSPEERELLKEGHMSWFDFDTFTQDKVDRVKDVFKKAFALPQATPLVGLTFPDAIVLQLDGDDRSFYAMVMSEEEEGAWEAMRLMSEGTLTWVKTTPFRVVLALLQGSICGMTTDTADETGRVEHEEPTRAAE